MRFFHSTPIRRLLVFAVLLSGTAATAAEALKTGKDSEDRMKKDVTFLASPICEGRGPLTKGIDIAADYVADQFKAAGLKPGNAGSYFQPFTRPANILEGTAKLSIQTPKGDKLDLKLGTDYQPMGLSVGGSAEAGIVFVGFGITHEPKPDPKTGKVDKDEIAYDDYAGVDVSGKIVVILRDFPGSKNEKPPRALRSQAPFVTKLALATKNGAKAVLFVNDLNTAGTDDGLLDFNFTAMGNSSADVKIPAFHVKRAVVDKMLKANGGTGLDDTEKAINKELKPKSRELTGWTANGDMKTTRGTAKLKNVIGVVEGNGPLAKETVVIGAHYDHLGYGIVGSRAGGRKMAIHPGADDNGSGTTAILELARRFAAMPNRQGRRLVFMAFSGEELGLFGSQYYCNNPIFPLNETAAMLNLDMVGRLSKDAKTGKAKLLSEGNGTAKEFKEIVDTLMTKYDFQLSPKASGFGPSDHASFCGKKVPVLFFWTGLHDDYHMPADTADKINIVGMKKVVDMSEEVATWMATVEKRPAFVEVKGSSGPRPAGGGPRLGIRPGYGDDDENGVAVEGVGDDTPAARGGIKGGDKIVGIEGKPVKNLQTYMAAMSGVKAGSTIEVTVLRAGKKVPLKVKLD
jgi:Zn-dependent M28 family amino/carboxypeptidase